MIRITRSIFYAGLVAAMFLLPLSAPAQVTTGNVTGRVVDSTGGVIPGANVVLISEAHGNRSAPTKTNREGDYNFVDVAADTYDVEVSAPAFKTTRENGIAVAGGDHVGVPLITLQVGATTETVSVTADATLVQTQSGERSFAIEQNTVESMPIVHSNFINAVAFAPGLNGATGSRLGAPSDENNIMMDGISAMDTGNNGQMLSLNLESIGEIKVITQGYQAEFGRSSGTQITAVTKTGSNQIHGSLYGIWTSSNWNSRSWSNQKNGLPQAYSYSDTYGFSVGAPIIIPKVFNGKNKLFFFIADEFRPSTTNVNVGAYLNLPTANERAGDFLGALNNQGVPIAPIVDNTTNLPFPNSTIPASRLYAPGVAVLNQFPLPNLTQQAGQSFNFAETPASWSQVLSQPVGRLDYVMTPKLRFSAKISEQRSPSVTLPGSIPGYNDNFTPYPDIVNYGATVDWTVTPSSVIEVTYGSIRNQLAGGGSPGAVLADPASNRSTTLGAFPILYPNAGIIPQSTYAYTVLSAITSRAPEYNASNGSLNMPPAWGWGSLVSGGPPSLIFPSYLNTNHTQDVAGSYTKIWGKHTIKGGLYLNHSFKSQNTGAGGLSNLYFQGYVNFGNDTNNPLDSGFSYANADLGVFDQYLQQSTYVQGSFIYDNVEGYLQDNWKVTNRLTLDYGMRFTHMTPQYDEFDQSSNFFPTTGSLFGGGPNAYNPANAQVLYTAGCSNGAAVCSGNVRDAKNPLTGQVLTAGGANTQVLIGTPIPGIGNPLDGIVQAGHGIANTNYTWNPFVVGPRFGAAYSLNDKASWVIRGGAGLFYDRPDGNTVFSTPGNDGVKTVNNVQVTDQNLYYGQLQTVGQGGLSPQPVGYMVTTEYNAKIPSTMEWQVGVQKTLPYQMVLDVSYVGNHAYNRFGGTQGGTQQNLNQVPLGTAYLPQYQDPTLAGTSTVPGAQAYTSNLLAPYPGMGTIGQNTTQFYDTYHSMQLSLTRRFNHGFAFGVNYTYGISLRGNTGLVQRYQLSNGVLTLRPDEAAYEANNTLLDPTPNYLKANMTWNVPGIQSAGGFVHQLTKDWSISPVLTAISGGLYGFGYSYQTAGGNVNITGSPTFGGNVYIAPGVGSGCSANPFAQFTETAITGPNYGSVQMESGRNNYLRGCPTAVPDVSFVRRFHFWKFKESKTFEFRSDIFNALNVDQITGRQTTATFNNPTSMTLENPEYTNGNISNTRSLPENAGLGAATAGTAARNIQLEVRIGF